MPQHDKIVLPQRSRRVPDETQGMRCPRCRKELVAIIGQEGPEFGCGCSGLVQPPTVWVGAWKPESRRERLANAVSVRIRQGRPVRGGR